MNTVTPELRAIFWEALDCSSGAELRAYLERACGADEELRSRVEALLRAHRDAGSFLEEPISTPTMTLDRPALPEAPGTSIGPYKLLEQIGEGGMGFVYMAEQTAPVRRKVALKIIKPGMDTKQVIARFEAERQALALMDHPNIARVLDAGATETGRPYFVMELVRGIPITDYCDREHLSVPERLDLLVLVCRAVQHAHQKGIIHRDIKPTNVLITLHDGVPVPKVIDFGIAKATGQQLTDKTLYTGFAQLVGTPLYMSPEQAEMSGLDVDTRSDIYSLGVLLYELLTGTTPFDAETFRTAAFDEIRRIIREEEPAKPSTRLSSLGETMTTVSANRKADPRHLGRAVRGELDWIVMKALEKDRRRRYETANDFAADVMRYLTDRPVEALPPSSVYRLRKFAHRNRKALAMAASVTALGLILVVTLATIHFRNLDRVRGLTQDVRQALAGARTAIEAGDLALAGRRVAEAQGRLAGDRRTVSALAAEADGMGKELEARQADDTRFSRFLKLASEAQDKLGFDRSMGGDRVAEEALAIFDAAREGDWLSRLERSYLTADRKRHVRETVYVTLVSLADYLVRWSGLREDRKSIERSQDLLRRAEAFHPPTRAFYFVRSECYRLQGNTAAADEDVERFRAARAQSAWDHYLPGHTAGWRGDLDEAIRSYQAALRLQPDHYDSLFFLAMRLSSDKVNRHAEAIGYWTACLALRPDHVAPYENRGLSHKKLGQLDAAEADYLAGIARAKNDQGRCGLLYKLAELRTQQGKHQEAEEPLRRLIGILAPLVAQNPDRRGDREFLFDALIHLGNVHFQAGRVDEAKQTYRRALGIGEELVTDFPKDRGHRQHLAEHDADFALWLMDVDRGSEAEPFLRRAFDLLEALATDDSDVKSLNQLAWMLATCPFPRFRNPARAVELARRAVQRQPGERAVQNTLGVAFYRAGDWNAAVEALAKSMALSQGGDSFDLFFLAMAHWQLGDHDQARAWYGNSVAWMEKNKPRDKELLRLRAEAAALLGVAELPADVFARPGVP